MKNTGLSTKILNVSISYFFMSEKLTINGEAMNASLEGLLAVEQFLNDRYLFRRNVLSGKAEFADKPAEGKEPTFRPLTVEALNSIVLKAKRKDVCDGKSPKPDIQEYINSEEVPTYDPINDYLNRLPQWDGQNHVANLFSRIPGISSEQLAYLCVWMRSVVAHWMQMDELHANECVPTLIGPQGCGKTTFLRRLLPKQLRQYYLDHLNLSNKFDKEMAKIVKACFRKPKEGEKVKSFNCTQLLEVILNEFPTMVVNKSTRIYLGRAMSELGFEKTDHGHITFYKAVPKKAS